jgi:hypothetical protein
MRKLLLLPLVLWACGGAKDAPPADTAAMVPAALTAADVVGSYTGTTMVQGPDSVMTSTWTAWVMADSMGAISGRIVNSTAPMDTVAFTLTISGDSTMNLSAPYTDRMAAAGSPQMMWASVGRANGNAWTGTVNWMVAGSDSVTQSGTWTGTRTP